MMHASVMSLLTAYPKALASKKQAKAQVLSLKLASEPAEKPSEPS